MTGGNAEIIERGYAALRRRQLDVMLAVLAPDVEIRDRREAPDAGVYHGREGALQALGLNEDAFESFELDPQRFVEAGDQVAVVVMLRVRGRGSGVTLEERIGHLWTVAEGSATKLQVYSDPDDAIAEALRMQSEMREDEAGGK
jgi:ketosteroid isomerase-like protein